MDQPQEFARGTPARTRRGGRADANGDRGEGSYEGGEDGEEEEDVAVGVMIVRMGVVMVMGIFVTTRAAKMWMVDDAKEGPRAGADEAEGNGDRKGCDGSREEEGSAGRL